MVNALDIDGVRQRITDILNTGITDCDEPNGSVVTFQAPQVWPLAGMVSETCVSHTVQIWTLVPGVLQVASFVTFQSPKVWLLVFGISSRFSDWHPAQYRIFIPVCAQVEMNFSAP